MISIYKNKKSIKSNELYKLLLQTDIQTIEDDLSTKSITQKEKKMKMKIKEERKLLINNKEHFKRKQNTFL